MGRISRGGARVEGRRQREAIGGPILKLSQSLFCGLEQMAYEFGRFGLGRQLCVEQGSDLGELASHFIDLLDDVRLKRSCAVLTCHDPPGQ